MGSLGGIVPKYTYIYILMIFRRELEKQKKGKKRDGEGVITNILYG